MAKSVQRKTAAMPASASAQAAFPPKRDFSSLSLLDLLEAREAHHVQLSSLDNVVATAVGRYLIREDDWYAKHSPHEPRPSNVRLPTGARTLDNSVIRAWSWPAVLVFVKSWKDLKELGQNGIPRALYMPDGRVVPTCVVEATPDEALAPPAPGPAQTSAMVGGGYACVRDDQGVTRQGSFGCLVYRDGTYYALTNRHVAGEAGREIRAFIGGEYRRVGESADIGLTKLPVTDAFPEFQSLRGRLNFDAGLVRLDDFGQWTSQVFGVGEIDEPFVATAYTLTLDLIGTPLRAFGGSTGVMEGEIRALFYQYRSSGGTDSATDVLIGARKSPIAPGIERPAPLTRPGDSGTLWFYDPPTDPPPPTPDLLAHEAPPDRGSKARRLRPIAMQWGGARFLRPDGSSSAFALGSFLSTICQQLDLEIERDWSTGHDEYWGKLGHFAIGWKACGLVTGKLKQLMDLNQARIGFGDDDLGKGSAFKMGRGGFVPLADVPDYVWVISQGAHPNEPIQHFADVDIQDIHGGPSMLDRCHTDPKSCSAKAWKEYFDGFKAQGVGPDEGALPFRVWQIWDAMVKYLKAKDLLRFVAAAGVLAHYGGDASQPLHCSYMHHGVPPMKEYQGRMYPVRKESAEFKAFKNTRAADVHSVYEEGMLEVDTATVLAEVNDEVAGLVASGTHVKSGYEAARATLDLMYDAQKRLPPKYIIDADDPDLPGTKRTKHLWSNPKVHKETVTSLAMSVRLLAELWQAAWVVGDGDANFDAADIEAFTEERLQAVYRSDRNFVPSMSLDELAASGKFEPPPGT